MKKLIFLSSVLLLNLACNSDDDNTDTNEEAPVLVTKINYDGNIFNLKYDGTKIVEVSNTTDADKTAYTYTGNLINQIKEYDSTGKLYSTTDLTYENDRLVYTKENGITSGSNASYTKTFTYSYPNATTVNCTRIYNYTFNNQLMTIKDEIVYTISNDNIIAEKDKYWVNNVYNGEITNNISYDNKKQPFDNILGFDKIRIYNYEETESILGGRNNPITKSHTNVTVNSGTTSYREEYSNTYDSKNYPTQVIEKQYGSNNQLNSTFVTNYTYNQ
ncbi:hypothetical protein [Epilithonimonas sp.]|uniref:hypothetical protein n=1 Tax=Epilithonimonas sp. TaxID=2894511 RepID=UPI0035AE836B